MASAPGRNNLRTMLDEGPTRPRRRFQLVAEVWGELSRVTWPSRQDAVRLSMLVVGVAIVMGIFLGLWDFGFNELVERVFLGL